VNGHQFAPGKCFKWHNTDYEITRVLDEGHINLVSLATGEVLTVAEQTLVRALFDGVLRFAIVNARPPGADLVTEPAFVTLDDCTPKQCLVAHYRHWVIKPLVAIEEQKRTRQAVIDRVEAVGEMLERNHVPVRLTYGENDRERIHTTLSVRGVYRWLQAFEASSQDIRSLIPNWHKRGRRNYLHQTVDEIVSTTINDLHLQRERHTIDDVYLETILRVDEASAAGGETGQLRTPSRSTIHRRIEQLDSAEKIQARQGKRAARRALSQYGQMEQPTRPLVRIEIDHTPADIILVDAGDGLPLGRPTLTSVMDVATKYPLGYYLGFEPPSYLTVCEALAHAFKPKGDVQARYGAVHDWIAYGLPRTLVVDNGREFKGHSLEDACLSLGIMLQYTPKMTPHFKGGIERLFRTQNSGLFHVLEGTTFANIFARGDYRSLELAKLTLHDVDSALHIFLLDYYAERFHEGLQGIPARRWEAFLADGFKPRLPANVDDIDILLGRMVQRHIFHYGVEIDSLRYNHPELAFLRTQLKKGEKVKIKYHPADLSQVYIYNPFDNVYLNVPAVNQAYVQGLSLWKHSVIRAFLRRERDKVDEKGLAWAKRRIQEIVDQAKLRQKKTSRQKIARWETGGRSAQNLPANTAAAVSLEPSVSLSSEGKENETMPDMNNLSPELPADIRLQFDPEELEAEGWRVTHADEEGS
jgi:putative transposase